MKIKQPLFFFMFQKPLLKGKSNDQEIHRLCPSTTVNIRNLVHQDKQLVVQILHPCAIKQGKQDLFKRATVKPQMIKKHEKCDGSTL